MSSKTKFDYDLIIIGSGAAGSVAAEIAARTGLKTAIVEAERLGGSAPNLSDVPVGALLTAAHEFDFAKNSAEFGLRTTNLGYNFPSVKAWKDLAVKRSGAAATGEYLRSRKVEVFANSHAHFISRNEISIGRRHLSADKFLLATGSRTLIPDIVGLEKIAYLTPETAIDLLKPPKSLAIVGAGATGVQFAELFAIFGTKVYLFEAKKRILSEMDDEVSAELAKIFVGQRGMEIFTSSRVIEFANDGPLTRVKFLRGDVEHTVKVEKVLLAAGREPNTDLGLANAEVEFDQSGIKTDEFLQTSAKNIWAAGDVLGRFSRTHAAIYEARIAAHNLTARDKITVNYTAMPRVVWTSPEIATTGMNEEDLVREDVKFHRSVVQNSVVARANIANFTAGFAKILTDQKGMILGATVMAPHAAETINELSLAIREHLTATQIAETIHPFGSWSEVVRLACAKVR